MANVHFIGGEKGGVGKSMVARLLAQYMIDKDLPFLGFDTDRSHGALLRFYSEYASPVLVDRYEALDAVIEAAVAEADRRVLVDLAAQTHDPLVKWMDESGVLELAAESGVRIYYWHVMDSGKDSVDLLKRLLDRFGQRLNYVLVLNELLAAILKSCSVPGNGGAQKPWEPGRFAFAVCTRTRLTKSMAPAVVSGRPKTRAKGQAWV